MFVYVYIFVYILILDKKRVIIHDLVIVKAETSIFYQCKYFTTGMSGFSWRES